MDQSRASEPPAPARELPAPASQPPSAATAGAQCTVHVGRIQHLRQHHLGLLHEAELERAQRYQLATDRDRAMLGAVLLRLAAARTLGVEPGEVTVDRTCDRCGAQHGRPRLPGSGLHASVSHSGDVVAVALTAAGPVGVDVEAVRPIDFAAVADRVCTPPERAEVRGLTDFYTVWTRKEAVLKATGEGLARPMTDLHVSAPSAAPVLLGLGSGAPPHCQLTDIPVADGYRACVAVLAADPVTVAILDASEILRTASTSRQS